MHIYEVGGHVRDKLLGICSKDIDYLVVGLDSYRDMIQTLRDQGFTILHEYADKFTAVARDSYGRPVDFVWARGGEIYKNGKLVHVRPGTLQEDLSRRDFTINAMAKDSTGKILDFFGGQRDLKEGVIRAVGKPTERFEEDPRRIIRAIRFRVQLSKLTERSFEFDQPTYWGMVEALHLLAETRYKDKIREELNRSFTYDALLTLETLKLVEGLQELLFQQLNLKIKITQEK
jgi:tRNA nucleotidyltransferase/poly(A) polymerase